MISLGKTRSLLRRLWQRSASDPECENDSEKHHEWTTSGNGNEPASLTLVSEGAPAPQPSRLQDSEPANGSVPEVLPPLDFEAEATAESFFKAKPGKQARGTFHEVDAIRWDHEEADWSLERFELEKAAVSSVQHVSGSSSDTEYQKATDGNELSCHLEGAFEQLRAFASQRRWRAAVAALDKAATQSSRLSKRERAAIERTMDAAENLARYRSDSMVLRSVLFPAQMPKDKPEPLHEDSRLANREGAFPDNASSLRDLRGKLPLESGKSTQKEIRLSILQVRKTAADRNWLSPKSSRALTRIGDKNVKLGRSEINALNYLLDRCRTLPELKEQVETLRKAIVH